MNERFNKMTKKELVDYILMIEKENVDLSYKYGGACHDLEQEEDLRYKYQDLSDKVVPYVQELDKDLHIYLNPSKRTLEQVCYDLMQMIKE